MIYAFFKFKSEPSEEEKKLMFETFYEITYDKDKETYLCIVHEYFKGYKFSNEELITYANKFENAEIIIKRNSVEDVMKLETIVEIK